jgi:hypothetical protein
LSRKRSLSDDEATVLAVLFQLLGGEEGSVRDARAVVRGVDDGGDLRLVGIADCVEEVR